MSSKSSFVLDPITELQYIFYCLHIRTNYQSQLFLIDSQSKMSIVTDFRSFRDFRQKVETNDSGDNKENTSGTFSTRIIVEAGPLTDDLMIDAAQLEKMFWSPQESRFYNMSNGDSMF